jgi:polyphenol oxidase
MGCEYEPVNPSSAFPVIYANWPAPKHIRAFSTTRIGGISLGNYASFNLGIRGGDDPQHVEHNRLKLLEVLPQSPVWLNQVHGTEVHHLSFDLDHRNQSIPDATNPLQSPQADAVWTECPNTVCAVLTADCLPVLFCDRKGTRVAAAHAGWKGLLHGVLERTVEALQCPPEDILTWMGPAITQTAFEVGPEVKEAFVFAQAQAEQAFVPGKGDRWHADLYALARMRLAALGLNQVFGQPLCTYSDSERFYSFRRDGATGRMATLIWIEATV